MIAANDPITPCPDCGETSSEDYGGAGLCWTCFDRRSGNAAPKPAASSNGTSPAMSGTPANWLDGAPMDPLAQAGEPLPAVAGLPYAHMAAGVVISGPTGGGRSSLVQAGLYDAGRAKLRCAYLGSEVSEAEFNARAADLAARRGDTVDDGLREDLARVRYLPLASVIAHAWDHPAEWLRQARGRFDVVAIDPLSSVASTLGMDFDKSNAEYVKVYDRIVQPLVTAGLLVVLLDNIGHAIEAKTRAKGASAKSDRADLTLSCKLRAQPEPALIITAQKVRSVRAPFQRGTTWIFDRATQRIAEYGDHAPTAPAFRPTTLMERVSRAVEAEPGMNSRALRTAITGKHAAKDLALELLIAERYVERRHEGAAVRHYSARPYRADDEPENAQRAPDPNGTTVPAVPHRAPGVPQRDPGTPGEDCVPRAPVLTHARGTGHGPTDAAAEAIR